VVAAGKDDRRLWHERRQLVAQQHVYAAALHGAVALRVGEAIEQREPEVPLDDVALLDGGAHGERHDADARATDKHRRRSRLARLDVDARVHGDDERVALGVVDVARKRRIPQWRRASLAVHVRRDLVRLAIEHDRRKDVWNASFLHTSKRERERQQRNKRTAQR
jgi:hypothetical protein